MGLHEPMWPAQAADWNASGLSVKGLFAYLESYSPRAGLECNMYLGPIQYSLCPDYGLVSPRKDLGYKFNALVFAAAFPLIVELTFMGP